MKPTRNAALAAGDRHYYTGSPCKHGHTCQRFTSTRACVECLATSKVRYLSTPAYKAKVRAYNKRYRVDNAERLRASRVEKYLENPAATLEASRAWKQRNSERVKNYCSAYKKANPGENAARAAKYLANRKMATPPWADLAAIKEVYLTAERLTKNTGIAHEVDHIHPLSGINSCGLHVHYNLQPIPAKMNRVKYNKAPHDIEGYARLVADKVAP